MSATNQQAQILLTFGLAYEVEDAKFWRTVKKISEESLKDVRGDTLALMETITFMKQADILSNKAMREISDLVHHLDTLSPNQLVDFTLMYTSAEMQNAVDISANISKLENALLAKQELFTPENFATISSVVSFDDSEPNSSLDFTVKLPVFLHANRERLE